MGETGERDTEVGGYRLIREIGRGGFGTVHFAEAPDGSPAAVKLLHLSPNAEPRFAAMFAAEVDAARRISPFCIAQVLDADPHAEQPWIASEYIEGRTLAEEVRADGPRTGTDLQRLAVSTATALTAIHRAGIVHRDLKPENIMMAPDGPRVIDFGIARAFEETARFTATTRIGTLHYMAPERLDDTPHLTPAVDVFAWGAVISYAASGRHAFSGERQTAVIKRILMDEPDCSGVPDELRGLVSRCLSKEPEQRPTAHQVLNILLGHSEDSADVDTALNQGNAEATRELPTEKVQLHPTRWETAKVALDDTERESEPLKPPSAPAVPPGPDPATPPYRFASRFHHSVGELAETMKADPDAAEEVFKDADERAALASWIIEDLGDTRIDRSLLRKAPKDTMMTLLLFISQARPDMPPVFGDADMSLAGLKRANDWISDPLDVFLDPDSEFNEEAQSLKLLEIIAEFGCQDPEHQCDPDKGCTEHRILIDNLRKSLNAFDEIISPFREWAQKNGREHEHKFSPLIAQKLIFHTLLHPKRGQILADRDRALLENQWKSTLPQKINETGSPELKMAHSLAIRLAHRTIQDMNAERGELSGRRTELRKYAQAHRNAIKTEGNGIWLGLSCGIVMFFAVILLSTESEPPLRLFLALSGPIAIFLIIEGLRKTSAKNREHSTLETVKNSFPDIWEPGSNPEKIDREIDSLSDKIDSLDQSRKELRRLTLGE